MKKLNVGENVLITVNARDKKGGNVILDVSAGEEYAVSLTPIDQQWTDWTIDTDANGFPKKFLFPQPLLKGVNYFCLCGVVVEANGNENRFRIGKDPLNITMPATGKLYYFANDYKFAYFNNKGSITFNLYRSK